jgi:hypothetical protein
MGVWELKKAVTHYHTTTLPHYHTKITSAINNINDAIIIIRWDRGGIGSMLRYLLQIFIGRHVPIVFPLGTFLVNCSGCFLIGMFYSLANKYTGFLTGMAFVPDPDLRWLYYFLHLFL